MKQKNDAQENQQTVFLRRLNESGMTFTLSAVMPIVLAAVLALVLSGIEGAAQTDWYRYLSYLLPQLCFAIALAVYFKRTKQPLKETYAGCKWQYFALAIALQFGLLFSLSELNGLFIGFLEGFGYHAGESALPNLDGGGIYLALLVIALLPAVMEETVFRGLLTRNMHAAQWGIVPTVLISGALFSIMHGSPEQTIYQFICGVCFALVAVRSGSVLPTIVSHFLNNAVVLILTATGYGESWNFSAGGNIAVLVLSALCFAGALGYLIFIDKNGNRRGGVKQSKEFWMFAGVGIVVCIVEWIGALVVGFTGV